MPKDNNDHGAGFHPEATNANMIMEEIIRQTGKENGAETDTGNSIFAILLDTDRHDSVSGQRITTSSHSWGT
jgi:hypothetical protein